MLVACIPPLAQAEQIVTLLYVNGVKKEEVFTFRTEDGDFLLRPADLKAAGFRKPTGAIVDMGGEPHLSLRSMAGVTYTFEEDTLTLNLQAEPSVLSLTLIDFASQKAQNVYYPKETSLFLNYGIDYRTTDAFSFQSFSLANELGFRRGDYLFLTDTLFTKDQFQSNFVRLHTSVTRDDRQQLRRLVFGDFFPTSGTLGSSVNLGGISFSKVYGIDPYFITYPTLDFSGQASLPSEIDIYQNGIKIRTERVTPGVFQVHNLSFYGGAGVVELVVRDSLGRVQRFRYPFYAGGNILLKKGLHDYSYNFGFTRENFGRESNRYGKPATLFFHRYGVADYLTLGFRGEADRGLINGGPLASVRLGTVGVVSLSLSGSAGKGTGAAADMSYQYLNRRFNARLFSQLFSRTYRTLAADTLGLQQNYSIGGGVGYTDPKFGSLSLDLTAAKTFLGTEQRTATVGYSKDLPGNLSLTAMYRRVQDTALGNSNDFFVGLSYTPLKDHNFAARYETSGGRSTEAIQAQKNPPLGEGVGFRALLEQDQSEGQPALQTADTLLQYNARHAIFRGGVTASQAGGKWSEQELLSLSGALVFLDGVAALTRPVTDSFAAVKVGDVEGVTVRYNSQDIGKTDASGLVFVTDLSSYNDNQLAFNDKDIPIEYYFPQARKVVSPPLRSGTCIGFAVKKLQPITGSLRIHEHGSVNPLEFQEVTLSAQEEKISFQTGRDGEFYLDFSQSPEFKKLVQEDEKRCSSIPGGTGMFLKPGTHKATFIYGGEERTFSLTIPDSTDPIVDLGQVVIDAYPETGKKEPDKEPSTGIGGADSEPQLPVYPPPRAPSPHSETAPVPQGKGGIVPGARGDEAPPPVSRTVAIPERSDSEVTLLQRSATEEAGEERGEGVCGDLPSFELYFRFGSTVLASPDDKATLAAAGSLAKKMPGARIVIEGHSDQIGSQRYNLGLSKARALAVSNALKTLGVSGEKITDARWFGKKRLKCFSLDEGCRKINRRVEIRFVSGR